MFNEFNNKYMKIDDLYKKKSCLVTLMCDYISNNIDIN